MKHSIENYQLDYEMHIVQLIRENLPLISNIVDFSKKDMRKLAIKDLLRLNEFNSNSNIHNTFNEKFHSILDLIFLSNISKAMDFLKFIDIQSYKFVENVPEKLRHKAISKIKEMVLTQDIKLNDNNNPTFLNYFGEIIAINHIINSSNNRYCLENIEYKLTNKKSIDFQIYDNYNNDSILIEIMNVHFQKEKLSSFSSDDFKAFLIKKFEDKYYEKTNLSELNHIVKVVPIIWNNVNDLSFFKSVFKYIDSGVYNFPLMFLLTQKNSEGTTYYQFSSVNSYFENQQ